VRNGEASVADSAADGPVIVITCDLPAFLALLSGDLSPLTALESGRIEVDGDADDVVRFHALFGWPAAPASA
jgi:putative sterol carrier protein